MASADKIAFRLLAPDAVDSLVGNIARDMLRKAKPDDKSAACSRVR